ncbi:MAG: GNAT family N-acetyltransferase [Clostridia bacterium]
MKIERATQNDLPFLKKLLVYICNYHHINRPDIFKQNCSKYTDDELLQKINDITQYIYIAFIDGLPCGYIFAYLQNPKNHVLNDIKTMYIDDLCVAENFRKNGVATALMDHIKQVAKSIQCYNITLNVWEFPESALNFYKNYGMKTMSRKMEIII